mgnify:CR=1 FL=1
MEKLKKVKFCVKCVESTERFLGSVTYEDRQGKNQQRTMFDENQTCSACLYYEYKKTINWKDREKELIELLNQYKKKDGSYDVLVPGSGGKDSIFVASLLKKKIWNESFDLHLGSTYVYRGWLEKLYKLGR